MIGTRQRAIVEFLLDNLVWFMLVAVLAVFSATVPNFFQVGIFVNIVESSTFVGVMAIGLAIVIIAGNMDLSVESIAALTAMVTGILFCSRGIGQLPGVYAGVLMLHSIQTAINLMGLPAHYTQIILGALVLAAVLLDTVKFSIRQRLT